MLKRLFDIAVSAVLLLLLLPLLLLIAIIIKLDSSGPAIYKQTRVGKDEQPFKIWKFRTMNTGAEKTGLITVGGRDSRITKAGYFLRKYKLDELPQLVNVLKGEMSLVGPRPEVPFYVDMYNEQQKQVLQVKPGITDYASIQFSNENEILAQYDDPQQAYIQEIMPQKLAINLRYIRERSFVGDLKILLQTAAKVVR